MTHNFHESITQSHLKRVLEYDAATGVFRATVARGKSTLRSVVGSVSRGYVTITIDYISYPAHRLAWLYVHGEWPCKFIDHVNGDRSDNRIANLRDVDQSINLQNQRRARSNNSVGLLGVGHADSRIRPYKARIVVDRKEVHLGLFTTPRRAHDAYLRAKRRLHLGCTI